MLTSLQTAWLPIPASLRYFKQVSQLFLHDTMCQPALAESTTTSNQQYLSILTGTYVVVDYSRNQSSPSACNNPNDLPTVSQETAIFLTTSPTSLHTIKLPCSPLAFPSLPSTKSTIPSHETLSCIQSHAESEDHLSPSLTNLFAEEFQQLDKDALLEKAKEVYINLYPSQKTRWYLSREKQECKGNVKNGTIREKDD